MSAYAVSQYDYDCFYRLNRHGLRGPEPPPKSKSTFRILAIGDSYVFGWGVDEPDTWVRQLEGLFRDAGRSVEVINGGMPGNSPVDYEERAEYLIPDFQPDLVLVCILQCSDIQELPPFVGSFPNLPVLIRDWMYRKPPRQPREHSSASAEEHAKNEMVCAKKMYAEFSPDQRRRFDALDGSVKQNFFDGQLNSSMFNATTSEPGWYSDMSDIRNIGPKTDALAPVFERIRRIAAPYSARVLSVLMPEGGLVNHAAGKNWSRLGFEMPPDLYGNETLETIIQTASDKARVPLLNLAPAFREHADDTGLFFVLDTHMAPAGHLLVAKRLFAMLQQYVPAH
jgi:hypothetical protein